MQMQNAQSVVRKPTFVCGLTADKWNRSIFVVVFVVLWTTLESNVVSSYYLCYRMVSMNCWQITFFFFFFTISKDQLICVPLLPCLVCGRRSFVRIVFLFCFDRPAHAQVTFCWRRTRYRTEIQTLNLGHLQNTVFTLRYSVSCMKSIIATTLPWLTSNRIFADDSILIDFKLLFHSQHHHRAVFWSISFNYSFTAAR